MDFLYRLCKQCLPRAVVSFLRLRRADIPGIRLVARLRDNSTYKDWQRAGRPVPPPHVVKQLVIREYQARYSIGTLVETGTFLGEMVIAQRDNFGKIISIELSQALYQNAVRMFHSYPHIQILQGDSGEVLEAVVPALAERALFWLDGHYSGGVTARGKRQCPILQELEAIFRGNSDHVLLIDDARCFTGAGDYPTVQELSDFVKARNANYTVEVEDDIIRAVRP